MSIELLAPAGDLHKAKIALMYGADAVYVGGKSFSLRARASNFNIEDIEELCRYAKGLNKKVYVTLNIIPHDSDLIGLDEYILNLDNMGVDAVIVSSEYIASRVKKLAKRMEIHLSTQKSVTNLNALKVYEAKGFSRIVLARELSIKEISQIKAKTNVELEVFIHGGMCSSFSGHCILSNHMTNRDANRGGCAHSCRWNYSLVKNGEITEQIFNMGSKDLMTLEFIPALVDLNIASLKIEGRLKSDYYLACVIKGYRMLIDEYLKNHSIDAPFFQRIANYIKRAENRDTYIGFFEGIPDIRGHLYDNRNEIPTQEYIGLVLDYDNIHKRALIEQRNYFKIGDNIEIITPQDEYQSVIKEMNDYETNAELSVAPHPLQKIWINMEPAISYGSMIRLKR